jgi:hypothetical protein
VLSTVLLVGVGFLAFEARDTRVQSTLDESVTAAGMGGVVDHVVDIEVALALASRDEAPDSAVWIGRLRSDRPLRWLRENREVLSRSPTGGPTSEDPRSSVPDVSAAMTPDDGWRTELLDQGVRRVIGALRDWAPVLGRSRMGQSLLVELGQLRKDLLKVQAHLQNSEDEAALTLMTQLRQKCRITALALEVASGSNSVRAEVLTSLEPFDVDLRPATRWNNLLGEIERGTWRHHLAEAHRDLTLGRFAR